MAACGHLILVENDLSVLIQINGLLLNSHSLMSQSIFTGFY